MRVWELAPLCRPFGLCPPCKRCVLQAMLVHRERNIPPPSVYIKEDFECRSLRALPLSFHSLQTAGTGALFGLALAVERTGAGLLGMFAVK